jgi:hypothetical protein
MLTSTTHSFEVRVSGFELGIHDHKKVLLEFSSFAIANSKLETRNSEPFEICGWQSCVYAVAGVNNPRMLRPT